MAVNKIKNNRGEEAATWKGTGQRFIMEDRQ